MKLSTSIALMELWAGGPGSGCNPAVGKCGRPAGARGRPPKPKVLGFRTKDGARVTVMVPRGQIRKRGYVDITRRISHFKGKFGALELTQGMSNLAGHEGQNLKSWMTEAEKLGGGIKNTPVGVTLFVYKYTDAVNGKTSAVILQEHAWEQHHNMTGTIRIDYKDEKKGLGLLKRRYGVKIPKNEW